MCIDFTDLNKACKKDPFPLLRIDTSIDKAVGYRHFLGHHQIWLNKEDEEKQVLLLLLEYIVTSECPKGSRTRDQPSPE